MDCDDNRTTIVWFFVSGPNRVQDAVVRQAESTGWTRVGSGPSPCLEKVVAGLTTSLYLNVDPSNSSIEGRQRAC